MAEDKSLEDIDLAFDLGSSASNTPPSTSSEIDGDEVDPIAVVGLSLKFPQEATTAEAFWEMLDNGRSAMTEFPSDRLNVDAFYHPDSSRRGTIPLRGGHFLKRDLAVFDAPFFSTTPSEAACMDPQQRILLEASYQALENAGIPMEKCCGTKTSVYTGSFSNDYNDLVTSDPEQDARYAATGLASSMLANRISWFFDFNGPSTQLDSACSSSLTALHIACQGLRNGEATMSLVGGSNLFFHPDSMLVLDSLKFLSHDSRCWSFDERANGYARGEGISVVVLKRLSKAIRDGDTIRAVIRATYLNQDGRTPGISQPSGALQETLIRHTYRRAGLDMGLTRFFEAHGTGTAVGDPIEAAAIGNSFRKHRTPEEPLYIGAVKSNIGHLEGASGIAGLIKTILALEKGAIPPNAGFERVNPRIDTSALNIWFPLKSIPWPSHGLRRASVNSFGFGGSNAHVVLDDAYNYLKSRNMVGKHQTTPNPCVPGTMATGKRGPLEHQIMMDGTTADASEQDTAMHKLLVWSVADEHGIERLSALYEDYSKNNLHMDDSTYFENLVYTLAARRTSFTWRSSVVASNLANLQDLESKISKAVRSDKRSVAFVFTGQGAQYARMGQELLVYPTFRQSLRAFDTALKNIGCDWSLLEKLQDNETNSVINNPDFCQPICTALQIALVDLLRDFNILPAAVVGHSSGEIAAAYCIGSLSRTSACKLAFYRGGLAAKLAKSGLCSGAMMSVGLPEHESHAYCDRLSNLYGTVDVTVGCINSPTNVTLTGDRAQMDTLESWLKEKSVFVRRLKVDVAYHSRHMNEIASDYSGMIQHLEPGETPRTPIAMFSTVSGTLVSARQLCNSEYWVKNMLSPVRFSETLTQICAQSAKSKRKRLGQPIQHHITATDLLEIGPHSALRGPIRETLNAVPNGSAIQYHSALARNAHAVRTLLETTGRLYCSGYPVNLLAANRLTGKSEVVLTDLPEYSFNHSRRHWLESRTSKGYRFRKSGRLDLLGTPSSDWNPLDAQWRNVIRLNECPWIEDHKMNGTAIYPAAGMLVMAMEAVKQMADKDRRIFGFQFKDVTFLRALTLSLQPEGIETQFSLRAVKDGANKLEAWSEYCLYVYEDEDWAMCCHGLIQLEYEKPFNEVDAGKEAFERARSCDEMARNGFEACNQTLETTELYRIFNAMGAGYGPAFQVLENISYNQVGATAAAVKLRQWTVKGNENYEQPHVIHPTTLDGLFQLIVPALSKGGREVIPTMVPTRINKLWVAGSGFCEKQIAPIRAYARSQFKGYREATSSVTAVSSEGADPRIILEGLETSFITSNQTPESAKMDKRHLCCNLHWKPDPELMTHTQTLQYCEASRPEEPSPVGFYKDLRLAIFSFIHEAVEMLGGKDITKFEPHLVRYVEWMRHQIDRCNKGELAIGRDEMTKILTNPDFRKALLERVKQTSKEGKLFVEVGNNLLDILDGLVDPLELLFKGDLANEYYQELNRAPHTFTPLATYLDMLAHKTPSMKILEIGAGTGGATLPILETLMHYGDNELGYPRFSDYHFTDISSVFFEAAQDKFKSSLDKMTFKVLDIENDPSQQGYDEGEYDLIFASNVLHATRNISETLKNTRKLLKPGGRLVLFEVTEPHIMRTGFAFGLLKGWWLAQEESRQSSPCLSEEAWEVVLRQTGFSGLEIALPDSREELCHEASIMITTAQDASVGPSVMPKIVIVLDNESTKQRDLAWELQYWLSSVENSSCEAISLQQASERADLDAMFCVILLEAGQPFLNSISADSFAEVKSIVESSGGLLWVTQDNTENPRRPDFDMVTGFARALRSEYSQLKFAVLALESSQQSKAYSVANSAKNIIKVLKRTISLAVEQYEPEYVESSGQLEISRVVEADYLNHSILSKVSPQQHEAQQFGYGPPLTLCVPTPGLLDSLEFREDKDASKDLEPDEVEVEVMATGVNFRDCLMALGQLSDNDLGTECAGIISRVGHDVSDLRSGDRVSVCALGTYKSLMRCKALCVVKMLDDLSFTEAASLPTVGITAYHALYNIARVRPGDSILIHSGAGGTGQLAIQIAQYLEAKVYVTVSSEEKKRLLIEKYKISEDCIFYSRDNSFAQGIKRVTKGRGVDVVLNSLSGEGLVASWECVAPFGRFVEIGKKDIFTHANLPMFQFARNVTFAAIDLSDIIRQRPALLQELFQRVMALVNQGKIHAAQPMRTFAASDITHAFRSLQGGKHIGKMVIEFIKDDIVPTVLDTKPAYSFDSNASYLIAGGLGGLGRSVAQWMASRGARHFILLSRSGAKGTRAKAFVEELRSQGCHVEAPACDITQAEILKQVLEQCAKTMPSIRGCIQGTMVLRDSIFEKMTHEDFILSTKPKVTGSWNLHTLLPKSLDFFVLLSSICGVFGAPSQVNYATGNTYKDGIAHYRIAKGEKAASIDLGMMTAEGVLAENQGILSLLKRSGFFMEITQPELFALLDHYCNPELPLQSPTQCQAIVGIEVPAVLDSLGKDIPSWMRRPLFRHFFQMNSKLAASSDPADAAPDYASLLRKAASPTEAASFIAQGLARKTSRILAIASEDIDTCKPLHSYGVDSLIAVEIRNWLLKEIEADVAIFDILGKSSVADLSMTVLGKSALRKAKVVEEGE